MVDCICSKFLSRFQGQAKNGKKGGVYMRKRFEAVKEIERQRERDREREGERGTMIKATETKREKGTKGETNWKLKGGFPKFMSG